MLTFRGAPPGKGLEAWRDNFSLKVGVVRIRTLVSKKYPIGKEGARARAPPDLGPWAQNLGPGPKNWALGPIFFAVGEEPETQEFGEGHPHRRRVELYQRPDCTGCPTGPLSLFLSAGRRLLMMMAVMMM